jgi:hypothetical protein
MINKTLFLIWIIYYYNKYGVPPILLNFLFKFYYFYYEFFNYYNKIVYPEYFDDVENDKKITFENNIEIINELPKETAKYEDKYLDDIRKLEKEWIFTEEENNELPKLIDKFYNGYIKIRQNRIEEITKEIINIEKKMVEDCESFDCVQHGDENGNENCDENGNEICDENDDEISYENCYENCDEYGDELIDETTLEERNEYRRKKIQELQEEANKIKSEFETDEGINTLKSESEIQTIQYIINKRLDKLTNCYVIEKTPNGNVLMIYEKDRESFKYYSDCNIPYRYLEVVGRKYVKLFGCRPIFIDMEEELRLFEEKWEKEQELKKIKEEEDKKKAEEAAKNHQQIEPKKNVFAKFKSYNKDAGGKISMAAPPKNSIPNKSLSENKENEKFLLKERSNRYTYVGKFSNFNFLQKIERKVFNKKLGLSFADFKKIKN